MTMSKRIQRPSKTCQSLQPSMLKEISGDVCSSQGQNQKRCRIPKNLKYDLENALVGLCDVWFEEIKPYLVQNNLKLHVSGAPEEAGDQAPPTQATACSHLDPGRAHHPRQRTAACADCCSTPRTASRVPSARRSPMHRQSTLRQAQEINLVNQNQNHSLKIESKLNLQSRGRKSAVTQPPAACLSYTLPPSYDKIACNSYTHMKTTRRVTRIKNKKTSRNTMTTYPIDILNPILNTRKDKKIEPECCIRRQMPTTLLTRKRRNMETPLYKEVTTIKNKKLSPDKCTQTTYPIDTLNPILNMSKKENMKSERTRHQTPTALSTGERSNEQTPLYKEDLINIIAESDKRLRVLYRSPTRENYPSVMNLFSQSQNQPKRKSRKLQPWK